MGMGKAIAGYAKVREGVCRTMEIIAYCSLVAILGMVLTEIILRSLFAVSSEYLVELPHLAVAYIPFLYVATAFKGKKHIQVSLIPPGIRPRLKRIITLGIDAVIVYACYLLLRTALALFETQWSTGIKTYTSIPIGLWFFSLSCPLGMGMLLLLSVEQMIRNLTGRSELPAESLEKEFRE